MQHRTRNLFLYAILFLLGVPALIHGTFGVFNYEHSERMNRVLWTQYPISLTVPYLVLALLFLFHCAVQKGRPLKTAYCGALAAWLCMMVFSIYLLVTVPSEIGPTGGALTVALTPFLYIPFLFLPYFFGSVGSMGWNEKAKGEGDKPEHEARQ